jgi:hypothetical protein
MLIKINKVDSDYIWNDLNLKNRQRADNNDEQWEGIDGEYYMLYDLGNVVIKALFDVLDPTAEMDSDDFCDWDHPKALYVDTDGEVLE